MTNGLKIISGLAILLGMAILPACMGVNAHNETYNFPLKVGDQCPDFPLSPIINYPKQSTNLSDYKGKLLILDFWATTCGSCIAVMPKMDSLQKQFGDKIQIMPVTYESESRIHKFQKTNKFLKGLQFATVVEDTLLMRFFPYTMIPQDVWIGKDGKVLAITEAKYVTAQNIQKVLDGADISLPLKQDNLYYDKNKPLFVDGNGGTDSAFLYRSLFSGFINGLPSGSGIQKLSNGMRIKATNSSILNLYKLAFHQLFLFPPNKIILEIEDSSRYFNMHHDDLWPSKNFYCYELTMPKSMGDSWSKIVQQDLNRYFRVNGRIEKRQMGCLILTKNTNAIGNLPDEEIKYPERNTKRFWANKKTRSLVSWLNTIPGMPYIIDESKIKEEMAFDIKATTDVPNLNEQLKRYGLQLKSDKREIPVFVLTEDNYKTLH